MRDLTAVKAALKEHEIELPSWAFGNSGTRFKVFGQPGVPRTPWEKAEDAAQVHRYTGVAPRMAVHIPWDKVDDYAALARHAGDLGIGIGAVNANVFQDEDYKLGSVCNPDPRVRKKAVAHLLECVDVMDATGSRDLKLWFADGTNYPGQDDIRARQDRLAEALATVYARLGGDQRMLLEYKLFEPSFYTTDVPDWGTSLLHCQALGPKAQVVVDTGHHAPAPTSSSSWPCCYEPGDWAASTSTAVSTPTTTSWWAPPTRSSCSGSCTRSSRRTRCAPRPGSRSCSTSATTSRRRSRRSSAR